MGCCSGNEILKEEIISDIKEKEKKLLTEEDYLLFVQNNIYRVQEIMSSYNKTDDIDVDDEDNIDTTDSNAPKKKYFRFYIIYQLTLGKLRSLIEDHLAFKNNKMNEEIEEILESNYNNLNKDNNSYDENQYNKFRESSEIIEEDFNF